MIGSKAVIGGVVCGAVAAVWLSVHPADDDFGAHELPLGAAHASAHHAARGWHWMPWADRSDAARPASPEGADRAEQIGHYAGTRIPVDVRVVDADGRPVRGAVVTTRVDRWQYADVIAAQATPTPDANGDGDTVGEEYDGYEGSSSYHEWLTWDEDSTGRNGTLTAEIVPGVATSFRVADRAGRRALSAPIELVREDGGEGKSDGFVDTRTGRVYHAGDAVVVTVELEDPGAIVGTVFDEHGAPIAGAVVSLSSRGLDADAEGYEGSSYYDDEPDGSNAGIIESDADGNFRVPVARPGAFDVEVHAPHYQTTNEPAVQVLPGRETKVSITLLTGYEIHGRVVDGTGMPVIGASVMAMGRDGSVARVAYVSPETPDGEFSLEELPAGTYTLRASAANHPQTDLAGVDAGGAPVTIRLNDGGRITGDLFVDPALLTMESNGTKIAMSGSVYVYVVGAPETPRVGTSVSVDESGRGTLELDGVSPGRYTLWAQLGTSIGGGMTVDVYEGRETRLSVQLPGRNDVQASGTVRGTDGMPAVGGSISFTTAGGNISVGATIDDAGHYRAPSLPGGEWTIYVSAVFRNPADGSVEYRSTSMTREVRSSSGALDFDLPPTIQIPQPSHAVAIDTVTLENVDGQPRPDDADEFGASGRDSNTNASADAGTFIPDVVLEPEDQGLMVLRAPPGPRDARLFPGDRVTSVDGEALDPENPYALIDRLAGAKDSLCQIVVDRPASHETITATLSRTRAQSSPPVDREILE